jgi:hypothetical protein
MQSFLFSDALMRTKKRIHNLWRGAFKEFCIQVISYRFLLNFETSNVL